MYALDTIKLESSMNEFPAEYQLLEINEELYEKALNDKYLAQFVNGFSNAADFINNGLGYFLKQENCTYKIQRGKKYAKPGKI